ncbi:uncharacterized protein HDF16_003080 [Granulicella aggregans]|uniref:DUF177 domain-containing protein n=1 Tax=Granulicella aggregans TaxID=474949 RepID=A0A7W8E4C7_9BACT|nr:DUF177 domain-containing protein [Granulicella aggregans]MBB5058366.1 uncharacterized protein [Granulicella aggregans]
MTRTPILRTVKAVLITPFDLEKESLQIHESIAPGVIDYAVDISQIGAMPVDGQADLIVEHRGSHEFVNDIRLRADYTANFEVLCARCLDPVPVPLSGNFDLIFRPASADAVSGERAITVDETEIGYYEESGLLLEDVVREQVLLSLPNRTLCTPDCKGLCPSCGQNLNSASCNCEKAPADPRWNALAGLAGTIKLKN